MFVITTEDFVKSRFCAIQFTVILAGLKNIVRYTAPRTLLNRGSLNQSSTAELGPPVS